MSDEKKEPDQNIWGLVEHLGLNSKIPVISGNTTADTLSPEVRAMTEQEARKEAERRKREKSEPKDAFLKPVGGDLLDVPKKSRRQSRDYADIRAAVAQWLHSYKGYSKSDAASKAQSTIDTMNRYARKPTTNYSKTLAECASDEKRGWYYIANIHLYGGKKQG